MRDHGIDRKRDSMYTLKIRWTRHEFVDQELPPDSTHVPNRIMSLADETTLFIPADEVRVHAMIEPGKRSEAMRSWDENGSGYFNYLAQEESADGHVGGEQGGRLICVIRDGVETWYLASHAWLLGPDGGTIERVAP